MDLTITSEDYNSVDWTWLRSSHAVDTATPVTLHIPSFTKATHYPNGRIKPGTILCQYSAGDNQGLFGPYVEDDTTSPTESADVPVAILLDGAVVREVAGSAVSTVTVGAGLRHGIVVIANLPGLLLEDGTTAYVPVAADLPAGFTGI